MWIFNCKRLKLKHSARIKGFEMNEDIKIVQLVKTSSGSPDYCLDDKGYVYKIEYNKSNLLTLVRQEINVVIPIQD